MITADKLRSMFAYNPDTGVFVVLVPQPRSKMRAGMIAGSLDKGYLSIKIDGRSYRSHRLAWLYVHGHFPEMDIDHRNGNKADNRKANLREATESQNLANSKIPRNNTSGFKGVSLNKCTGKWRAQISVRGNPRFLGEFDTPDLAHQRYMAEATKLYGEFARAA